MNKKSSSPNNMLNNSNYLTISLATYFSIAFALILVYFIGNSWDATIDPNVEAIKQTLLNPNGAQPEPKERLLFFTSVAALILGLLFSFPFLKKIYSNKSFSKLTVNLINAINISFTLFITFKAFQAANPFADSPQNAHDTVAKTNFDFYFLESFLHENLSLYGLLIFPLITFFTINSFKKPLFTSLNKWSSRIALLTALMLSLLAYGLCTFEFPYTFENKYDLNAVYYSVVQVFHGNVLLSKNFTNTYGLYPQFIVPILKLTGLSFSSFSTIMGLLLAFCFFLIYWFLNKVILNKWFVLLGMCSVFYLSYVFGKIVTNYDPYFAIHPIRWLFPCILIGVSSSLILKPKNFLFKNQLTFLKIGEVSLYRILLFLLFSFGILWNPDFGIFTFLALLATILYIDFDTKKLKASILHSIFQIVIAIFSVITTFYVYSFLIFIFYDQTPDFNLLFKAINSFAVVGYFMLPLPDTYHPWMLFSLVYIIGWALSINSFYNNEKTKYSIGVFMLTVLGTLSLTYYQGRSHNWNLMVTNFEAFLLLVLFADKLYEKIKTENYLKPMLGVCLFYLAFSPFQVIASLSQILDVVSSEYDKEKNIVEEDQIKSSAEYIRKHFSEKDSILILSADHYQSLYHTLIDAPSAVNPGFVDLFTKEQYSNLTSEIAKRKLKIFLEPNNYRPINMDVINVLQASYEVQNDSDSLKPMYIFQKKNDSSPSILPKSNKTILQSCFRNNFDENLKYIKGYKANGNGTNTFSIELIIKPYKGLVSPLTKNATLLSSMNDSLGFVVQQYGDNPKQFLFGSKLWGSLFNLELGKWNYLAINVDHNLISVFVNGEKQSETLIPNQIDFNREVVYIGSYLNQGAYYFGGISEFRISSELIGIKDIKLFAEKTNKLVK